MITRFSLYGFLKNQRYFEPFLVLLLMERGLSFTQIGVLVGGRELAVNLMEIPTGILADRWGRRRAMIASFLAYILSFAAFGFASSFWEFASAMLLFAVGDAARTGTHKAMIFTWLRREGRLNERTRVYGLTRSWSKIGSAVSSLLAALFVGLGGGLSWVFWGAMLPYALGVLNFLGYPAYLDGLSDRTAQKPAPLREVLRGRPLLGLIGESMGFEGTFAAAKDYLQPAILAAVVASGAVVTPARTAWWIGGVYFTLFLLSAVGSRQAHRVEVLAGGAAQGAGALWWFSAVIYGGMLFALLTQRWAAAVLAFAALYIAQNLWRPALVARVDEHTPEEHGATVLSVESQARSLATAALAPLLGVAVDRAGGAPSGLWVVAVVGVAVSAAFALRAQAKLRHP